MDALSDELPFTVTFPGVWRYILIFGSTVVAAEKERFLFVDTAAPSTLIERV
jgi:hypothetical protein